MAIGDTVVVIHAAMAASVKHASKITVIVTNAKLDIGETVARYVIQVVIINVTRQRVIVPAKMATMGIRVLTYAVRIVELVLLKLNVHIARPGTGRLKAEVEEFALHVLKIVNIIHVLLIPGHANTVALMVSGEIIATSHAAIVVMVHVPRILDTVCGVQINMCMAFLANTIAVHLVC